MWVRFSDLLFDLNLNVVLELEYIGLFEQKAKHLYNKLEEIKASPSPVLSGALRTPHSLFHCFFLSLFLVTRVQSLLVTSQLYDMVCCLTIDKAFNDVFGNNIWFLPNMVWNDGMWYGMVRYGIFQYGMVWYTMVWYDGMAKSAADTLPRFCLRCSFPPVHPLPHELAASWQQNRWKQTNKQTNRNVIKTQ